MGSGTLWPPCSVPALLSPDLELPSPVTPGTVLGHSFYIFRRCHCGFVLAHSLQPPSLLLVAKPTPVPLTKASAHAALLEAPWGE